MNEEDEVETYYLRSGTKDEGQEFEIWMIILMALHMSFDLSIKNFKISSNNEFWGDFDDCVFEIQYKNNIEIIIAIQLKHTRKNITLQNITNAKGDYSLDKYYRSYKKILESYSVDEMKNIYLVLYTTGGYSQSIEEFHWRKHRLKKEDLEEFPVWPKKGRCFQLCCCNSHLELEDVFLSRLFIFTNQRDSQTTQDDIRTMLQNKFEGSVDLLNELFVFVQKWRKGLLDGIYKLTKNEIVSELCVMLLSPCLIQPKFDKQYDLNHVELWKKLINNVEVTFVQDHQSVSKIFYIICQDLWRTENWNENNWTFPCISLEQVRNVPKRYFLSKAVNHRISTCDLYLISWKIGLFPLILSADNVKCDMILKILSLSKSTSIQKNFVIYVTDTRMQTHFNSFSIFSKLSDIKEHNNELFENSLKELDISVQNRFNITLQEMDASDETFARTFTPDNFLQLMENNVVGVSEKYMPEIYIKRRISEFHVHLNVVKYLREEVVFIFCGLNHHYDLLEKYFQGRISEFLGSENVENFPEKNILLVDYSCNVQKVRQFLALLSHKNYHIFVLTEYSGSYTLKWIESSCSVDLLKEFASKEQHEARNENELFSDSINNLVNVIRGLPGMGKSYLLNRIHRYCSRDSWIIKIELIQHSQYFNEEFHTYLDPTHYFFETTQTGDSLSKVCFESFQRMHKVMILLDGFDEVSPKFTDKILKLMEYFKSRRFIQWITTRPATAVILEKYFNVLCYDIVPFGDKDKMYFIKKYVEHLPNQNIKIFHRVINGFSQVLDGTFFSIPLQVSMLCEIIKNNLQKSIDFRSVDVLQLYDKFIEMKFNIFEERYLKKQCHPVFYDDYWKPLRKTSMTNHQICSLIAVFGHEKTLSLVKKSATNLLQRIREGTEKNGIIINVNQNNLPVFLHQSIAEYLAATWLADNWKKNRAKHLLKHTFSLKTFSKVRLFFDKILARGIKVLEAVLDQDFEKLEKCSSDELRKTDAAGRNALHLVCSWKLTTDEEYVQILLEKGFDPKNNCDKLFNFVPLDYAVKTQNNMIIDRILRLYNNLDISKLVCSDFKTLMYRCMKDRCLIFLERLADYLNTLEDLTITAEYDSLLFSAVESNDVKIMEILLRIKEFRRHIMDKELHGNAALQLALILERHDIIKKLINFDIGISDNVTSKKSPYEIAVEESNDCIKSVLMEADRFL